MAQHDAKAPKNKHPLLTLFLILGSIGLVGLLVVGVGGYFWVKKYGDSFMASTKDVAQKGIDFGRGRSGEQCVDEATVQVKDCLPLNVKCTMNGQVFLHSCLSGADVSDDFCQGVPEPTDILDSISYRKAQCERRGLGGKDQCSQIMQGVQSHCATKREAAAQQD